MPTDSVNPALPAPPIPQSGSNYDSGLNWGSGITPNAPAGPQTVGSNELISTHLKNVIDKDGPLMKMARTEGRQYANKRGLINSSIAAGAAGDSVIRQALPIANSEAAPYQQRALQTNDAYLRGKLMDQESRQSLQSDLIKQYEGQAWQIKSDNQFSQNRQGQYEANEKLLASRLNMIERMSSLNLDRFIPQGTSTAVR